MHAVEDAPLVSVGDVDGQEGNGHDDAQRRGGGQKRIDGDVHMRMLENLQSPVFGRRTTVPFDGVTPRHIQLFSYPVEFCHFHLRSICKTFRIFHCRRKLLQNQFILNV